jgi:dATP pyrophosphohydrolase
VEKDEKAPEAALRELAEETGLLPRAFWVAPFVTSFYDAGWDAVNLCPVFAVQVEPGDTPRLSREHSEAGWFSLEEAVEKLPWPAQQEALRVVHQHIARGGRASGLTRIA